MVFAIVLTFLLTSAAYATLAYFAWQRLARHLKGNPDAVDAFSRHVVLPLLGEKPDEKEEEVES